MRLLYLHHGDVRSATGAEMMTRRLAVQMHQRGHHVRIIATNVGDRFGSLGHEGLETVVVDGSPESILAAADWRPDLVHLVDAVEPSLARAALLLAQRALIPLMFTPASDFAVWKDPEEILAVCRQADLVCSLTEAERQSHERRGIEPSRLAVVGQGPALDGAADPERYRRELGLQGEPLVLFLGRKVRFKGYRLLLRAMERVWHQHPDTSFVYVGGRWDADCADLFNAYRGPRVVEKEYVDEEDKASALAAADILCLPSTVEVFPLAFVEAWAFGKPVVTSTFPGAEEVVAHGRRGLVVEPQVRPLADVLVELLLDSRRRLRMGAAARSDVLRDLSWPAVAMRTEECYRQLPKLSVMKRRR